MVEMFVMHGICLNGLLGIHLNLRRLLLFRNIHFLILAHSIVDLIMPLFGVICVILLTMLLVHVLIMHAMRSLTLYHHGTILMLSYPYLTHPFLKLSI